MSTRQIHIFILTTFFVLANACLCFATNLQTRLQHDFRPVEAVVLDVSARELTLDTGISAHISKGDLFTIFRKGRPFYLPESHKVLGYEKKRIATCRINQVTEKTSTCSIISEFTHPAKGDLALRYEGLKAAFFIGAKPVAPELPGGSLKDLLPWFKWLEPASGPSPVLTAESMDALGIDILFQVRGNELYVYGPGMKKLDTYYLPPSFVVVEGQKTPQKKGEQRIPKAFQGIELFDFHTARIVGSLNQSAIQVQICDLDGDGRLEVVYLLKNRLCIAPYRRQGQVISVEFAGCECACNFSLLKGKGWLCINTAIDQAGLSSKLFRYGQGHIKMVQDQINLWLNFIDTDCDGIKDTLLGQAYERARFRGRKIFILRPSDSGIEYVEQADYPTDFNVNSALWADLGHRGCSLFYVSFDGFFKVFSQGRHIWSSLKPVVRNNACCGPSWADLVDLSKTAMGESGIIFNGSIALPKGKLLDTLILFSQKRKTFALFQAEVNLKGRICGISVIGKDIVIATRVNTKEQGEETVLYEFRGR